ncbi:Hypothetical protein PBC10988_32390 [Planctomycetales bacterium 10988]|nr:Hypothetical protein PBC10988_32390 [Planctomycetales bacterium 10988]
MNKQVNKFDQQFDEAIADYVEFLKGSPNAEQLHAHLAKYEICKVQTLLEPARNGNPEAQTLLGICYLLGYDTELDYDQSLVWLGKAAEQSIALAQWYYGYSFYHGLGVDKDFEKAFQWFDLASKQGFTAAYINLGILYKNGLGVEEDVEKAVELYMVAAKEGFCAAQQNLGLYYYHLGGEENLEEAFRWFSLGAKAGFAPSQYSLSGMYKQGSGVEQNYEEALKWLQASADQNFDQAFTQLGCYYASGEELFEQDFQQAHKCFLKAGELGDRKAYFYLSHMYEHGQGVEKDLEKADYYYDLSGSSPWVSPWPELFEEE